VHIIEILDDVIDINKHIIKYDRKSFNEVLKTTSFPDEDFLKREFFGLEEI